MAKPWDQMPDYLEAVRRERRPGDPKEQKYTCQRHCADDVTGFIVGQAQWTVENLPNILYTIKQPKEQKLWGEQSEPRPRLDAHGQRLLERWPTTEGTAEARPLRDIPVLPDQICYYEKWWRIEAWRRLDPRIGWDDIVMRQMPIDGVRKRSIAEDRSRLLRMRSKDMGRFCILDWYAPKTDHPGHTLNKRVYKNFERKHLQANSSRGITPGLIDPAEGEALGNRVPLPAMYNVMYDPVTLSRKHKPWKLFPQSQEPGTVQLSAESSDEEQNVDLSEDEASLDPRVKRKTPGTQLLRVGKSQKARTLRSLKHNQHNDSDDKSIGKAGKAKQKKKNNGDLLPVADSEASNEDQGLHQPRVTVPSLVHGKRRQKLRQGARLVSDPDRNDQQRGKIERSPSLIIISSSDEDTDLDRLQVAAASTRSARGTKTRYNLRKKVSARRSRSRSGSSPSLFGSMDFSDTDSEKFVPSDGSLSDSGDEIADVGPRIKRPRRGNIEPKERISREPSQERSTEVRIDSLDDDINMDDLPLKSTDEPNSKGNAEANHINTQSEPSSAGVGYRNPRIDIATDETRPNAPAPSHGTPKVNGIFMDTLVDEMIELRSRISGLERRESLKSKSVGDQVDKVAKMAIELRAGSDRLLDEIASLRATVDQCEG